MAAWRTTSMMADLLPSLSLFLSFFYICGLSIARGQDAFSQLERGGGAEKRSEDRREIKSYGLVARDEQNVSFLR